MEYVLVLAVLFGVVFVVTGPLRRPAGGSDAAGSALDGAAPTDVLELEAARDAKYRELLDVELDHQTGKLSDADFQAIDSSLRTEAIDILHELDQAMERGQ